MQRKTPSLLDVREAKLPMLMALRNLYFQKRRHEMKPGGLRVQFSDIGGPTGWVRRAKKVL